MNALPQKPPAHLLLILGSLTGLALTSCSSSILFATRSSVGLEVSGDIAKVPDHVNLGYRRREIAYVGKGVPKTASVLGRLDSETTWNGGAAISETFATGKAAERIADPSKKTEPSDDHVDGNKQSPLVFASRTRIGMGFNFGGADDDAIPSLHFGYSRRIATRMDINKEIEGKDIPSIIADTKVHSSGVLDRVKAPQGTGEFTLSPGEKTENTSGGTRIANLFAVGSGADKYVEDKDTAEKLNKSLTQQQD